MRLLRLTPTLDIVLAEPAPSPSAEVPHHTSLFQGYPSRKVRLGERLLRAGRQTTWGHLSAALGVWLCREELVESLRGCDPDRLDLTLLHWGPRLRRVLEPRFPQWFGPVGEGSPLENRGQRGASESPLVTVVLPVHNVGHFLEQSMESCLTQTYAHLELIIVDDGSTDDVAAVPALHGDRRARFIRHDENRGIAAALNTGFAASRGDFLTWTSDDNFYEPRAIETMVGFLQRNPDVDFVYSDMFIVDERAAGQPVRIREAKPPVWFRLRESNPVGACFLYRRAIYETLGDYDTRAFLVEDYEYWLRVARRFRMQRLRSPLYHYRYHPETLTATHARNEVVARVRRVRRQHRVWAW